MKAMDRSARRILIVEKMIMMPVKAAFVAFALLFYWAPEQEFDLLSKSFFFYQTILYTFANVIFFLILTLAQARRWASVSIKVSAFLLSIIDNLYVSLLIPLTGGLESPLYWAYTGLMVRNAVNFPKIRVQGLINLALCVFFAGAVFFSERDPNLFLREVFYLRLIVLILVSVCCWGIYALIERRVIQLEDGRELQLRREKIHAIQRLAGEIVHGLKNPLSIMNNAAYYLEKHLPQDSEELRAHLAIIRDEVGRSDKILSEIMDYARLSNVRLLKLNVNEVLKSIIEEMRPETAFPGIRIEKKFQRNLPAVFFDEGHLKQIFSNLIVNAAEAVTAKGRDRGSVTLSTRVEELQTLIISIADNGNGMSEEEMRKIFTPFYTTKEKGTGLGLSIVKNVIETYDGRIEVRSKVGEGSVFTVYLPVRASKTESGIRNDEFNFSR